MPRYKYTVPAVNGKLAHPVKPGKDVIGWNVRTLDVVITTTKPHPELEEHEDVTMEEVPDEAKPEEEPKAKPEKVEAIEDEEEEEEEDYEEEEEDEYLDEWTVAELREEARDLKIKGCSRMSKAELVDAVFEAQAQE